MPPLPPTVIVFRIGSLGDTVVALPFFHEIARRYADHRRILLTNRPVSDSAPLSTDVLGPTYFFHETVLIPPALKKLSEALIAIRCIRRTGAKTLIYLMPKRTLVAAIRDYLFFRICGIRQCIGIPMAFNARNSELDKEGFVEREALRIRRALSCFDDLNLDAPDGYDLRLTVDEKRTADDILAAAAGPYIAVNAGGKASEKDWGDANWVLLLSELSSRYPNYTLIIVGAYSDFRRAEMLLHEWKAAGLNLCGKTSPRTTAAVLGHCHLFIGHDSGPLHLAAAVGVPAVGIFGPFNAPREWHPFGENVRILHNVDDIQKIRPEDVVMVCTELIICRIR